jgi:hypothetical protein
VRGGVSLWGDSIQMTGDNYGRTPEGRKGSGARKGTGHARANRVGEKEIEGSFSLSEQEAVEFRHGLLILLGVWEKAMTRLGFLATPTAKELRDMYKSGI